MTDSRLLLKKTLSQLGWWMGAGRGIETYHGQFMCDASTRWAEQQAQGREQDIYGIYLMRWDDFETTRLLLDQMRNASGFVFKTIPAPPAPRMVDGVAMANAEILIDTAQPQLEEKLLKASELLLSPYKEHSHKLAQQLVDRFRAKEAAVKSNDSFSFSQRVDAFSETLNTLIECAFNPTHQHQIPMIAAHLDHKIDDIARLDIQNDAVLGQCYRIRIYMEPLLTVLGANAHHATPPQLRTAMDALGFPNILNDLKSAGQRSAQR